MVKRYYAAAVAGQGSTACALLAARIASSKDFAKVVPPEYVPAAGSSTLRGKSCAQVAELLFNVDHQELAAGAASVQVSSLSIQGSHGLAALVYTTMPEREIPMDREHGTWRIGGLVDIEMP